MNEALKNNDLPMMYTVYQAFKEDQKKTAKR